MAALVFLGILFIGIFTTASACQDGQRNIIRGTRCSAFEECKSGQKVLMNCKPGYLFDTEAMTCLHHSETTCLDDATECENGVVYGHPYTCRLYYKCIGSKIVSKFCPAGQLFDSGIKACRHGVSCDRANCIEGSKLPVEGHVSHYDKCVNGKLIRMACSQPGYFDKESHSCKQEDSPRKCSEGETRPINCKEYLVCKNGEWVQNACPLGETYDDETNQCISGIYNLRNKRNVALCNEGHKRRVEGSCKKYTECVNGEEVENSCSPCMNFDDSTLSCRYVFLAPCPNPPPPVPTDPPTTPKPTTTSTTPKPTTEAPLTTKPTTPSTEVPLTTEPTTPSTEAPLTTEPTTPSTEEPKTTEPTIPTTEAPLTTEPTTPSTEAPLTTEPTTPSTEVSITTEPTTISTEATTTKESPNTVKCKDGERKAVPGDCKSYLECLYGKFYTNRCNYFQHFDLLTLDCKVFRYTCA